MVETLSLNFRVFTVKLVVSEILGTLHITETSPYKSDPRFPSNI